MSTPTAEQLNARAKAAGLRAALANGEADALGALTSAHQARAELAEAVAAGDEGRAGRLRSTLRAAEDIVAAWPGQRAGLEAALTAARDTALAGGAGFELMDKELPLLLLPVRLETRYAFADASGAKVAFEARPGLSPVLLVRVFPDDWQVAGHEPELTPAERAWQATFAERIRRERDLRPWMDAWVELVRRAGPARAAYLAHTRDNPPAGRRPSAWTRAPRAAALPDRFVAYAWTGQGGSPVRVASDSLVREPLLVGPDPLAGGGVAGPGLDWLRDFQAARHAGMALVVPLPSAQATVERLIVFGVRASVDGDGSGLELARLLDGHHYVSGLGMLRPGAPTSSLPGGRSVYRARPDPEELYPLECQYLLWGTRLLSVPQYAKYDASGFLVVDPTGRIVPEEQSAGLILAQALGIDPTVFAHAEGAGALDGMVEASLRRLLGAAFGPRMTRLLSPALNETDAVTARTFYEGWVSGLGPLPVLRLGRQPYGVVPIALSAGVGADPASFEYRLRAVLDGVRLHVFGPASQAVPRVGAAATTRDPGQALLEILRTDGVARELRLRPLLGPEVAGAIRTVLSADEALELQAGRADAAALLAALGANPPDMRMLDVVLTGFAPAITAPVAAPADAAVGARDTPARYLELLLTQSLASIAQAQYPEGRPTPLLFAIARLALLEAADDAARQILDEAGQLPADWDGELSSPFTSGLVTVLRRLEARHPNPPVITFQTIGDHLGGVPDEPKAWALRAVKAELRTLRRVPPESLDVALRGALGPLSYRLDAWYTALADLRLRQLRGNMRPPPRDSHGYREGVGLGAWATVASIPRGRLVPVPPGQLPAGATGPLYTAAGNAGYVHGPSVAHAATAAVLRSAHLAHQQAGHGDAFSVDLSSRRVRAGLELLEGVRGGQPLSALLGYRIERGLSAAKLQRLIAPLRGLAPLVAGKLTPGSAPAEAVAASNVVDGLELLTAAGQVGAVPPNVDALISRLQPKPTLTPTERTRLQAVLDDAYDRLDAAGDLALAESVFQTVQGNPVRSGAAAGSVSGAPVPPVEPEIVRRARTGIAVTHRLAVAVPVTPLPATTWSTTPRASAEPRLEALARAVLPDPDRTRLLVKSTAPDGTVTEQSPTLAALLKAAATAGRGELGMAAIDLVLASDVDTVGARTGLDARLAALIALYDPPAGDEEVHVLLARDPAWPAQDWSLGETLEVASALRALLVGARTLRPLDVAAPGQPPGHTADGAELVGRADGARNGLVTVQGRLTAATTPAAIRAALLAAEQLGVPAAPASDRDSDDPEQALGQRRELERQRDAALADVRRRIDAEGDRSLSGHERLEACFGRGFPAMTLLRVGDGGATLANSAAEAPKRGATTGTVRAWLARAALHRPGAARLDAVLGYVDARDAVDTAPPARGLDVVQLPHVPGEPWIGGVGVPLGGRAAMVAVSPAGTPKWDGDLAGLVVDEWVETVPAEHETTSLTFHYDGPTSAAPQAALLCVEPNPDDGWQEHLVLAHIQEAIALAELRGVDLDLLGAGQFLPALVAAERSEGSGLGAELTEGAGA